MSNSNDLNDIFGPLRSSAMPAELADEVSIVDAMAKSHNASKGRITMLNSRKARVATLIAAGIIGFGGVAAAGPGGLSQTLELPPQASVPTTVATTVPEQPPESEPTTATTEVPETSVETKSDETGDAELVKVAEESEDPDTDTDFNEAFCVPDGNHGKTVSAVARGEDGFGGADVRDAAHSSCGKDFESDDEESVEAEHADDDDDDGDDDGDDHDGDDDSDDDDGDDDSDDDSDDDGDDDDDDDDKDEKPARGNSSKKGHGKNPKGD